MFENKKQAIPFPQFLDSFGTALKELIAELRRDSLKPAIMSDIVKLLELLYTEQQMMVLLYNGNVKNHEKVLMPKMVKLEQEVEELKTKLAGYSERLNKLEGGK